MLSIWYDVLQQRMVPVPLLEMNVGGPYVGARTGCAGHELNTPEAHPRESLGCTFHPGIRHIGAGESGRGYRC